MKAHTNRSRGAASGWTRRKPAPPKLRDLDAHELAVRQFGEVRIRDLARRGISVVGVTKIPSEPRSFTACLETVYRVDVNGRLRDLRYVDVMSL